MTVWPSGEEHLHFKPDRRGAARAASTTRREAARIYGPCVAVVHGMDANGQDFKEATTLENLSARGLYMKTGREISVDSYLFIVFAISSESLTAAKAPTVAVRGQVRRVEPQPGDAYGLAIVFQRHRFL